MRWLLPTLFACTPSSPADTGPAEDRDFSYPLDDVLTIADAQVKGTHNSYHVEPDPLAVLEWGYTHAALDVQARELGVRQFELDVHIDPDGGDLTVFHVPIVDDASTCATLGECLGLLASWSRDNPAHLPILVMIEPKGEFDGQDFAGRLDLIDESIAAAWPRDATVTPDDVRGDHESLREALLSDGWPALGTMRGAALFGLLDRGVHRDEYTADQTSSRGHLMFPLCDEDASCAGLFFRDDPVGSADDITALAAQGFLIRTRADAASEEAWAGDTSRLDAALAAGAHFISTDYPAPVDGVDYAVEILGGTPARCNPVTAPAECTPQALEDPAFMR